MIRWVCAFVDRPVDRLGAAVAFWAAVTGDGAGDEWVQVRGVDGPGGAHLSLAVDDVPSFVAAASAAGAGEPADHGDRAMVSSPAGLPVHVAAWRGQQVLPAAHLGPGGEASLLDQVCLDIGPTEYDAEVAFWATLTGWELQLEESPEFRRLVPPAGLPVQLLLQRLGTDRPAGAHVDLACSDVAAVRAAHERLGATVVGEWPNWTVMRDPAGGDYCLTRRRPPGW